MIKVIRMDMIDRQRHCEGLNTDHVVQLSLIGIDNFVNKTPKPVFNRCIDFNLAQRSVNWSAGNTCKDERVPYLFEIKQVAQLPQRDRAAEWVSYGQKWKTGTGSETIFTDSICLSSTTMT